MEKRTYEAIGLYRSDLKHPYEAGRQPDPNDPREGYIELNEGFNFQQALIGLDTFTRIWIVFDFNRNTHWHPMVQPPRGATKQGVFATRSPHRPNGLGLSSVKLVRVEGLRVYVRGADLLDGTPVLDLKPYIAEVDAHPNESRGWLAFNDKPQVIEWSMPALEQLAFLEENGVTNVRAFVQQQLEYEPFNDDKKRVSEHEGYWTLAYRTWRIDFVTREPYRLEILRLHSGYSVEDLQHLEDKWQDKELHRRFRARFK